jgi:hypothetical protein
VLTFTVPPGFSSSAEFRKALQARLAAREDEEAVKLSSRKERFAGVRRVLKQSHTDRPASAAPRRGLNPRVAAGDKWKRLEALSRNAAFLQAYREALDRFRGGARHVVFPRGTYLLRVHLGVTCQAA